MVVKKFKLELPITLEILVILKKRFNKFGKSKGAFVHEIATILSKSKTMINEVLRFLEEKNLIYRKEVNNQNIGKKKKENFISPKGMHFIQTEIYDKIHQSDKSQEIVCNFVN